MNIKKILCKYFSEEDKKTVTIGSIIDTIALLMLWLAASMILLVFVWAITAILLYIVVLQQTSIDLSNDTVYDITYNVLKSWAVIIGIIGALFGLFYAYVYSHSIKITQCERKD